MARLDNLIVTFHLMFYDLYDDHPYSDFLGVEQKGAAALAVTNDRMYLKTVLEGGCCLFPAFSTVCRLQQLSIMNLVPAFSVVQNNFQ